ncbi:hypothetical protein [Cognaticolwellia aestuarii]|uniref:hypothetical protein n=1 Tax=Cognaticolwellia aestuarii TaxID=329993 RepID=UPI0011787DC4|nr:hypothetical protein [Cognaticolwellia aestuarii]
MVLVVSRGMALAGFFLLAFAVNASDFQQYALYFAVWQLGSQLLSLQLGTTFFRCGLRSVFTKNLHSVLSSFYPIIFFAFLIFVIAASFSHIMTSGFFMSLIVAIFIVVADYARASINERIVFIAYMLPGLLYLTLFFFSKYLYGELTLLVLLYSESTIYVLITIYLLIKCDVKFSVTFVKLKASLKKIRPFWYKISLPLIPNNLLWYFYFNAPVIIGYKAISDVEEYNEMALFFRFIVAISTASSTLALVFQKKIISIYENDKARYLRIKSWFISRFIPFFLIVCLAGYFLMDFLWTLFYPALGCEICNVVISKKGMLLYLFYIFLNIYLMSHYFVAEKDLSVISPSMVVGFIAYTITLVAGLKLGINFGITSVYSLCISLTVTFIIRYLWLTKQRKLKNENI